MNCPHGHVYKITVRNLLDYKKLLWSRGRLLAFNAYLITLADGTVVKDCANHYWRQARISNMDIHNIRLEEARVTFYEWLDTQLTNRKVTGLVDYRAVLQFILDYNTMHGKEFDKKYEGIPPIPDVCKCTDACMCFEFSIMRHVLEPSNG